MNQNKNTVIITGANGYIGSNLVKTMLNQGFNIIAIDIKNNNIDTRAKYYNTDIFTIDENDYIAWGKPKILIHLAWNNGFNHFADSHMENLPLHFNFLKKLISYGIESISVMGSVHEIGYHEGIVNENTPCNPLSYYGIAKNTLRQLLNVYTTDLNISFKWLRAFYIVGNDFCNHSIFTKILEADKEGKVSFPFTNGANKFDFININELTKQIYMAATQNKIEGIINVCSGNAVAIKDEVQNFIKENHLKIKLDIGKFPSRKYDSPIIFGDNTKIETIKKNYRGKIYD